MLIFLGLGEGGLGLVVGIFQDNLDGPVRFGGKQDRSNQVDSDILVRRNGDKVKKGTELLCGRARSCSPAGVKPAPEGWPATG